MFFPAFELTICFNGVTHGLGPAQWVDKRTPHVAPEVEDHVVGDVALVGVHQPETAANDGVDDGQAGAAHVFGVHHLHACADPERGLHALRQLTKPKANSSASVSSSGKRKRVKNSETSTFT